MANALAGIRAGAVHVQGTINGYGERCGNSNLVSIIANLNLKMGMDCVTPQQLKHLTELANFVSEMANLQSRHHAPYVGNSAFAHKGGVHVNAVMKNVNSYQHIDPDSGGEPAAGGRFRPIRQRQHRVQAREFRAGRDHAASRKWLSCSKSRKWRIRATPSKLPMPLWN